MRTILVTAMLTCATASSAFAQGLPATSGHPSQAIDIPGDGGVSLEERLAREPLDRSLLVAQGFDFHSARAIALMEADRFGEAEALLRTIISDELAAPDRHEPYLAWLETGLARAMWRQDRRDEAEQIFRRALGRVEWRPGEDRTIYWVNMNFGALLAEQGRFAEAEPLLRMAVSRWSRSRGRGSHFSLRAQLALAYVLFAEAKTDDVATMLKAVEAQIIRYGYDGSDIEARAQRLRCLLTGACTLDSAQLRAEASRAIAPGPQNGGMVDPMRAGS